MLPDKQRYVGTEVRRIHAQEGEEEQELEGQLLAALLLDHLVQDMACNRRSPTS